MSLLDVALTVLEMLLNFMVNWLCKNKVQIRWEGVLQYTAVLYCGSIFAMATQNTPAITAATKTRPQLNGQI